MRDGEKSMTGQCLVARWTLPKQPVPGSESYHVGHQVIVGRWQDNGVQDWFANPTTPTRRYRNSRFFGSWTVVNLQTLKPPPPCRDPVRAEAVQTSAKLHWVFPLGKAFWKQKEPWIHLSNISKNMPCLQISITSSYLYIETCPHLTQPTWISQAARRLLEHWRSQRLTTGGKNEHQGWMPSGAIYKQAFVSKHVCIKQISYDIICVYTVFYILMFDVSIMGKQLMLWPSSGVVFNWKGSIESWALLQVVGLCLRGGPGGGISYPWSMDDFSPGKHHELLGLL